jgi:hypothetical protein
MPAVSFLQANGNPWVQARDAVPERGGRAAAGPGSAMTAREIRRRAGSRKAPQACRRQAIDLQAAILSAPGKHDAGIVAGEGAPARWKLAAV